MIYKQYIKRSLDFLLAVTALLMLFPLFAAVWIILLFNNKGKAFFLQKRPGKNEVLFNIIKFKSMNDRTDKSGKLLPDSDRLTKTGARIRKYSLDEIPQLLNVIKGDMSLIGPRPLLPKYLLLYNDFQKQRHTVKPGITGWAQVNGRNAISWEEKFEFDVWYIKNMSFWLDLKILFLTVLKVFKRSGINTLDDTIMPEFTGSTKKE
jgi:undecaprenyl phosphate N,N'-diacetylbacillosamine 1-phosphate transferase